MAASTTPTHGKYGAIYRLRENNFKGSGLNDLTLGLAAANAATAYYEIAIDGVGTGTGNVDTFKWRKNGGGWTTTVDITGSAQTLDESQAITFTATTGHTATDQWTIGNLKDEACDESGTTAQITSTARRILNPNATLTWTDSGGAVVQWVDYSSGTAHFDKAVTAVTVTGNNAFIVTSGLQKVGYTLDWSLTLNAAVTTITSQGDSWDTHIAGIANGTGSASAFYIANACFFTQLKDEVAGTPKYYFLQLFTNDPNANGTGDHFNVWAIFTSTGTKAELNSVVNESLSFTLQGPPAFIAAT